MTRYGTLSRYFMKFADLLTDPRNPIRMPYYLAKGERETGSELDSDTGVKVSFTIDVEHDFGIPSTLGRMSTVEEGTRTLMNLFDDEEIEATFFVSNPVLEGFPEVVEEVSGSHEVGVHGYEHEVWSGPKWWLGDDRILTPEEKENLLGEMVEAVEETTGERPRSFRAPYMAADEETLKILDEKGFEVDSSAPSQLGVFPKPCFHSDLSLVEIPISADPNPKLKFSPFPHARFDWLNTKLMSSLGGEKSLDFMGKILRLQAGKGVTPHLVLLLHQWEFLNPPKGVEERFEYAGEENVELLSEVANGLEERYSIEYLSMRRLREKIS